MPLVQVFPEEVGLARRRCSESFIRDVLNPRKDDPHLISEVPKLAKTHIKSYPAAGSFNLVKNGESYLRQIQSQTKYE